MLTKSCVCGEIQAFKVQCIEDVASQLDTAAAVVALVTVVTFWRVVMVIQTVQH